MPIKQIDQRMISSTPPATLLNALSLTATSATFNELSSRFVNLVHTTPNDGINPVLFIGERGDGTGGTVVGSLTGFNTMYDEINNNLIVLTNFGAVPPLTAVTINSNGFVGVGSLSPNHRLTVTGSISATNIVHVNRLQIKDSSLYTNTTMGSAVLSTGGTVTVNTTNVTSNSRIFVTTLVPAPNFSSIGSLFIGNITSSTSFAVSSTNVNDRSTFSWLIVDPSL